MKNLQPETVAVSAPPRRWPLFLAGVLLFLLGPALYLVQFRLHHLWMPWYVPIMASVGLLFMIASVWRRWGIVRSVVLVLCVVVCGFEWFMVLVAFRTPLYSGPAQIGHKVPVFATTLADGSPFTDRDLENGMPTVLVFFRGRW